VSRIILDTARLTLREMTPDDIEFIAEMMAHPEVNFFYERRFSREESEIWLKRQIERYERDGTGLWLVFERATGQPVGQVGLAIQTVQGERLPEVGWLLHRTYWGRGYATEAGAAVRDSALNVWGHPRIISLIRPVNLASQRVAQRLGMVERRRVQFHGFEHCVFEIAKTIESAAP
jgi:RimJ/RimL family protein N-acetyltransferase